MTTLAIKYTDAQGNGWTRLTPENQLGQNITELIKRENAFIVDVVKV